MDEKNNEKRDEKDFIEENIEDNKLSVKSTPEQPQESIILRDRAIIFRDGKRFEIPVENILTSDIKSFKCRKCNHVWFPSDRTFDKVPQKCPKCFDNFWFVSKDEMKALRKQDSYSLVKSDKPPRKQIEKSPKSLGDKQKTEKEVKKLTWD